MRKIAIVAITYNRLASLRRLLKSLENADYDNNEVTLIISIDNSGSFEISNYANEYHWKFGEKIVIAHNKRLGLKKHVISCGNLSKDYDAIIALEDDIYVSPYFYSYVLETIDKYDEDDNIAGISLYTHLWNVFANRPFSPLNTGKDVYFMQQAQSWGQIWTKRMWNQFYDWYKDNNNILVPRKDIPSHITNWPESSWLKYYNYYIIESNKYFVYPYIGLSTNFTDTGTHNNESNSNYQVPLLWSEKKVYNLPDFDSDELRYDIFFENKCLHKTLGLAENELTVDMYGIKPNINECKYLLSTKLYNFEIIKEFGLNMRPHEVNIIADNKGTNIYLYNINQQISNTKKMAEKNHKENIIKYDCRGITFKTLSRLFIFEVKKKITGIFKRYSK